MKRADVRAATADDVIAFYGEPAVPHIMLALDDGSGIGGLALIDGEWYAVSWLRPWCDRVSAMRLAIRVLRAIESANHPVYAVADPDEPTAARTLQHLGFRKDGERYVYDASLPGRFYLRHDCARRLLQAA